MYTVIGFPRTRAMRVMWTLEELGQDYDLVPAMPQSPEVVALNPLGKVPVLKDGGHVLTDSVAICQYLADKHGALTCPAGTPERARQDAVTQFTVDEVEGALWTAAKNSFIHPEELRVPEIKRVCAAEFATAMQRLEVMLGDGPFVMGETFTVPDILLGHAAGWARAAKFDVPETGPVADYFDRVTARPAFKAALLRGKDAGA
jgi:glutathione S-transferase